jgi:sugar phosphate isomerase/epimerase
MNRRNFSLSAAALATVQPSWSRSATPLFSKLGVCTALTNAEAVKAAGGDYIEEAVGRLLMPGRPESEWLENRAAAHASALPILACNSFLPGTLKCTGPAANPAGVLQYAETAFLRARQAGVKIIVFGSGGSRRLPGGFPQEQAEAQFVALLKKMGPLAEAQGVTIAIEPLRRQECNFINTVLEGAAIVERTNHPGIRLLFDIYHMLQNGEDPIDLEKTAPLLVHGHIAEKENRSAPGVAGDDFRPFFAALKAAGYKGRLSIEGKWNIGQLPKAFEVIRRHVLTA